MSVLNNRYGKWMMLQVESSFPNAEPGLMVIQYGVVNQGPHYVIVIPYEIDILLE